MANPLTGDFEAVLQVSGATVNRLLATMHQNGGAKTTLPAFTHGTQIRIGDPTPIDGMRGTILFQVSVPRIDLIHGVSDRFWLEIAVRARYKPDPGSVPIPEFIHGTVRAQYRIDSIDPSCRGWERKAPDYLWIRVIGDTVSFTGTAEDDATNEFSIAAASLDPAVADARITRLARALLRTRFEATPHKVSRRFRRGSMRSLHVGANRTVVAVPIGLTADPPAGRIDSINQDLLEGRDFGIAIDRDFIMSKVQQEMDAIKESFQTTFGFQLKTNVDVGIADVDVLTVTIDWSIKLTAASAQWLGGTIPVLGIVVPGGLIVVKITGQARTQKSVFNWDFDVTQFLLLSFHASKEEFVVTPFGPAIVNVFGSFGGIVGPYAKPQIQAQVGAQVQGAAGGVTGELSLKSRKDEMIKQLQTIDDQANAWFDEAVFTIDGVIVRGHIALSPRRGPVHSFAKTAEQDGHSAFESWIPGGRIDSFGWSWTWFNNGGDPGSETRTDRFVLRRPHGGGRGRFGVMLGLRTPLPGLDGMGRVCLVVNGVQVHPVTGELVAVSTARKCRSFGFEIRLAVGRVFLREWVPGPRDPLGPVAEVAIHEVGGSPGQGQAANTLVVHVGDQWNRDIARSLREGLASSRRRDAGLVVLVLFKDGVLMKAGSELIAEFGELAAELEAPLVVNEDVRGSWSKALFMDSEGAARGEPEWRLVSPTGGVTWAHSGYANSRELASALDDYLFSSTVPDLAQIAPGLLPGTRLSSLDLDTGLIHSLFEFDSPCPPPPFGRFGVDSVVAFVTRDSAASDAALRKLAQEHGSRESETFVAVVFDGAGAAESERLKQALPDGFVAIPDPDGVIARHFGVRVWPSNVTVNEVGMITGFEMGADITVGPPRSGEAS
jgi:hypothetical protein